MGKIDKAYWTNRYKDNDAAWDLGSVSTPLKEYIDQLTDKSLSILIPGAGNSYEAEYLFNKGFTNVFLLDISPLPLQNFKERVPQFPDSQLICQNFFEHHGQYDLILEQTFFCAIDPSLRESYVTKAYELLKREGVITGLLFDAPMNTDHPPFGGSKEEYIKHFSNLFKIKTIERCYNSIAPRAGREVFINLKAKK